MSTSPERDNSRLTPAQQALFEKRLQDALALAAPPPTIRRRPDQNRFPLSFAQERFWFLQQLDPAGAAYNRPAAIRLHGPLQAHMLERALSEVARRHEILRAIFPSHDGQPQQVIIPPGSVQLPVVDISALPPDQREARARELAREETRRPFGLTESPPWRAILLRLASDTHVLLLPTHHIISDAWSSRILLRELAALYSASVNGKPSPLPELVLQYADFAHWQRQVLQGKSLDAQLAYWRQQLANLPPALELPSDRARPLVETDRGRDVSLVLPPALGQALRGFAQAEDATLFMVLLAAFQVLLYRYTAQEDIVVGSPVAGRSPAETEELIGCFINTLVLRANLAGNSAFCEFLSAVRTTCLDAFQHSDLPFEQLLAALNPTRDLSRAPLFQVMFNSHLLPVPVIAPAAGLCFSEFSFDSGIAQFDLSVDIHPGPADQGLTLVFSYNTDELTEPAITRMLGHYRTLLEGIVADPAQRIASLPLLTPAERHEMLVTWNATQRARPEQCLHEMVEQQVQRHPQGSAVRFPGQNLNYAELNSRANQMARFLRRRGVGPETIVAVALRRTLDMPLSLLAILKAGGAYLPLDPDLPAERLKFML